MPGQQLLDTEHEVVWVHTTVTGCYACTSILVQWHLKWLITGMSPRIYHQSRSWLAAVSGLTGGVQRASNE